MWTTPVVEECPTCAKIDAKRLLQMHTAREREAGDYFDLSSYSNHWSLPLSLFIDIFSTFLNHHLIYFASVYRWRSCKCECDCSVSLFKNKKSRRKSCTSTLVCLPQPLQIFSTVWLHYITAAIEYFATAKEHYNTLIESPTMPTTTITSCSNWRTQMAKLYRFSGGPPFFHPSIWS